MGLHNSFPSMFYSSVLFICLLLSILSAQDIIISGHVYTGASSNGVLMPVEGAQIGIAMDSIPEGTIAFSDEEGYYELAFEWTWNGPIPISCQADGYEFYYSVFDRVYNQKISFIIYSNTSWFKELIFFTASMSE